MTPQVQQVFVAPIAGTVPNAASLPDISGGDALLDVGLALDGPGFDFVKIMQDDAEAVQNASVILSRLVPHPAECGAQAAVAMQMLAVPSDPNAGRITAPAARVPVLPDQPDDTVPDPLTGLADSAVVPMPIQAALGEIPQPPTAAFADGASDPAAKPAPDQPPLMPPPPLIVERASDVTNTRIRNADVEKPIARKAEKLLVLLPVPVPVPVPIAIPANGGPIPFVNPAPAPAAPQPLAAMPQQSAKPATAPLALARADPTNSQATPTEVQPKTTQVTPAETMFRLRAGEAGDNSPAAARGAPAQMPERAAPTPLPARPVTSYPINTAAAEADLVAIADEVALPPLGAMPDPLSPTPAIGGPVPLKPTSVPLAQLGSIPPTSPPVTYALPPRLTADLTSLAKTSPNGPVEILLNPEELGHLRFEIHQKADQLRVVLSVERPETLDLLRRNADQLLGEFRSAGFSGASLSFAQWDQQNSDPRAPPAPPAPPPSAQDWTFDPPPPPRNLHPAAALVAPTGLNIRL